jgi:hypothetical protein
MRNALRLWIFLSLSSGLLFACGDDASSEGSDAGLIDAGAPLGEEITAAEGGMVEVDGAKLEIPAGALAEDTEITVRRIGKAGLPDAENIASDVFELGPDGTVFESPVTLSFDFDPSETPEDKEAVLAWLDDDAWSPLPDSQIDGDTVTATTTHFSVFAVIWRSAGQVGGSCDHLEFTPCGGDIVGLWEITLGCAVIADEAVDPLPECSGDRAEVTVDLTGSLEYRADMSYSSSTSLVQDITVTLPKSCLNGAACTELTDEGDVPFEDSGDACERTTSDADVSENTGTYTTEGDTVTLTEDGMEAQAPDEYCVDGDTLTVRHVDEDGNEVYFRATRN